MSEESVLRKTHYITEFVYLLRGEQLGQLLGAPGLTAGEDAGAEQAEAGSSTHPPRGREQAGTSAPAWAPACIPAAHPGPGLRFPVAANSPSGSCRGVYGSWGSGPVLQTR